MSPAEETIGVVPLLRLIDVKTLGPALLAARVANRVMECLSRGVVTAAPILASKRFTRNEDRRKVLRDWLANCPRTARGVSWQNTTSRSSDCARTPFAKMEAPEVTSGISRGSRLWISAGPIPAEQRRDGERLEVGGDMFRLLHLDGNRQASPRHRGCPNRSPANGLRPSASPSTQPDGRRSRLSSLVPRPGYRRGAGPATSAALTK